MKTFFNRLIRDEFGATAIEYGLICGLIVVAMIGAFNGFADSTQEMWTTVSEKMSDASSNANGG
jgi:pilus assembly protein Flp/PilA